MKEFFKNKRNIVIVVLIAVLLIETVLAGIFLFVVDNEKDGNIEVSKTPATIRGKVMDDLGQMVGANIIVEDSDGKRVLYTTNELSSYEIKLAEGTYNLYYTRGMQYSTVMKTYSVENYKNYYLEDIRLVKLYDSEKRNFYAGDLHMHTIFSDGTDEVSELVYANIAQGLSWATLTDHNDNTGMSEWMQSARLPYMYENGVPKYFTPMPGVEITTGYGHFQSIGSSAVVEQWDIRIDLGHDPYERVAIILDEIARNKAIVQLNHPYSTGGMGFNNFNGLWDHVNMFDTIEIWNGYFEPCGYIPPEGSFNQNRQSMLKWFELLNNGEKLFATGGTDLHSIKGSYNPDLYQGSSKEYAKLLKKTGQYAGMPTTFAYMPQGCNVDNIMYAVKNGHTFISNGPLIFADVDGATYGQSTSANGGTKTLNLEAFCRDGLTNYNIYKNGEIIDSREISGTDLETTVMLNNISAGDWIVIEMYGSGVMYAVTNPIFFN